MCFRKFTLFLILIKFNQVFRNVFITSKLIKTNINDRQGSLERNVKKFQYCYSAVENEGAEKIYSKTGVTASGGAWPIGPEQQ